MAVSEQKGGLGRILLLAVVVYLVYRLATAPKRTAGATGSVTPAGSAPIPGAPSVAPTRPAGITARSPAAALALLTGAQPAITPGKVADAIRSIQEERGINVADEGADIAGDISDGEDVTDQLPKAAGVRIYAQGDVDYLEADRRPQEPDGHVARYELWYQQWHKPAASVRLSEAAKYSYYVRNLLNGDVDRTPCRTIYRNAFEARSEQQTQHTIIFAEAMVKWLEQIASAFGAGAVIKALNQVVAAASNGVDLNDLGKLEPVAKSPPLDPMAEALRHQIFGPIMDYPQTGGDPSVPPEIHTASDGTQFYARERLTILPWWSRQFGCCSVYPATVPVNVCVCSDGDDAQQHDKLRGSSTGGLRQRVNLRARMYRLLDALCCKMYPWEGKAIVDDGHGGTTTIFYQDEPLYTYYNPVFGLIVGSVFPPTDEDEWIPNRSWGHEAALAAHQGRRPAVTMTMRLAR